MFQALQKDIRRKVFEAFLCVETQVAQMEADIGFRFRRKPVHFVQFAMCVADEQDFHRGMLPCLTNETI